MTTDPDLTVEHEPDSSRYVLFRGGDLVGTLAYHREGDVADLYSTQIDPAARGKGLGGVLVKHVLDDLRDQDVSVEPSCWYVADFLAANPEYQEMRAA